MVFAWGSTGTTARGQYTRQSLEVSASIRTLEARFWALASQSLWSATLLGQGLLTSGVLALPPTIAECCGEPGPEARDYLKGPLGVTPEQASPQQVHAAVCEQMVRSAILQVS